MLEKQNAVERKTAAGDAAELDDIIDAGTRKFERHDEPARVARRSTDTAATAADL